VWAGAGGVWGEGVGAGSRHRVSKRLALARSNSKSTLPRNCNPAAPASSTPPTLSIVCYLVFAALLCLPLCRETLCPDHTLQGSHIPACPSVHPPSPLLHTAVVCPGTNCPAQCIEQWVVCPALCMQMLLLSTKLPPFPLHHEPPCTPPTHTPAPPQGSPYAYPSHLNPRPPAPTLSVGPAA
jgi:hypothetical protein